MLKVHPSQLKAGCLLVSDVVGKTMNPIIPKDTVIKPLHMKVLNHFLINEIEVAPTLVNGEPFQPKKEEKIESSVQKKQTFLGYYVKSIKETKHLFSNWKNRLPIDIVQVRNHLLPLLEIAESVPSLIFTTQHYVEVEDYYYHHSVSTALIAALIAKKLNYSRGDQIQIALAAYLSDCGMAHIDDELLFKKASLTLDEYKQIKRHPIVSYRLVESLSSLKYEAKIAILQHHERLDGSGYPFGLSDKVHPYAKIIAVSDMFHAMTSERIYKTKQSPFKVLEEMRSQQLQKLDIGSVDALVQGLTSFSIGTKVQLSDRRIGEIVFIDDKNPTRPIVRLEKSNAIISLIDHLNLHIDEIVSEAN
jgi:HD-GYP domain-containing protein (c-di-GMP phosphodiesterase class II)